MCMLLLLSLSCARIYDYDSFYDLMEALELAQEEDDLLYKMMTQKKDTGNRNERKQAWKRASMDGSYETTEWNGDLMEALAELEEPSWKRDALHSSGFRAGLRDESSAPAHRGYRGGREILDGDGYFLKKVGGIGEEERRKKRRVKVAAMWYAARHGDDKAKDRSG